MRAVVVRGRGALAVEDVPDPVPEAGQAVLRVAACGVCGTDVALHRHGAVPDGAVMGHEFSGEVVEAAGGLRAGERVTALPVFSCGSCDRCRSGLGAFCTTQRLIGFGGTPGGFAEYVAVSPHEAVRLPDGVDDVRGALVEPLAVGLHALNAGRMRRGERALVLGAGPIGLAIVLWARHFGAREIVVVEPGARRREMADKLGATALVDPHSDDLAAELERAAPGGPDVVYEAAGVPGLIQQAIDAVRFRGRVVVAGLCLEPDPLEALPALRKEASLLFSLAYEKDDFQYTVDLLDQGRIEPDAMLGPEVGLVDLPAAFATLSADDPPGKIIVRPGG